VLHRQQVTGVVPGRSRDHRGPPGRRARVEKALNVGHGRLPRSRSGPYETGRVTPGDQTRTAMGDFDDKEPASLAAPRRADGARVLRLSYADLIGGERGRDLLVNAMASAAADGVAFCRSVFATSPMGDVIPIEGGLADGLPDVIGFPDLSTARPVPWEPGVAQCIADIYNPDGTPAQLSPRNVLRRVIAEFAKL